MGSWPYRSHHDDFYLLHALHRKNMSIINQVLKDLEKRKANQPESGGGNTSTKLQPPEGPEDTGKKHKLFLLLIFLLVIFAAVYWWLSVDKKHQALHKKIVQLNENQTKAILRTQEVIQELNRPSAFSKASFTQLGNKGVITLFFDRLPHYHFSENADDNTLTIVSAKTEINNQPAITPNTFINNMSIEKIKDTVVITITFNGKINLESVAPSGNDLILTIDKIASPEEKDPATSEEAPHVAIITEEQQLAQLYQDALDKASQSNYMSAEKDLEFILSKSPEHADARKTLAVLYIRQQQYEKAMQTLRKGLSINADHEPFISLIARIYLLEDEPQSAADTLKRITPPLKEAPDYYALLAATEGRLGNDMYAAELYRQLLSVYPNKSEWWVGLAAALEKSGQNNAALQAYKHAVSMNTLPPNVAAFANKKVVELGG